MFKKPKGWRLNIYILKQNFGLHIPEVIHWQWLLECGVKNLVLKYMLNKPLSFLPFASILFRCWCFIYQHPIRWNYWYLYKETVSNSGNIGIFKGIYKNDFHDLLNLATKESFFTFKNKFYIQVDGVAMGSPLGLILANIFLSHHEENWLNICWR